MSNLGGREACKMAWWFSTKIILGKHVNLERSKNHLRPFTTKTPCDISLFLSQPKTPSSSHTSIFLPFSASHQWRGRCFFALCLPLPVSPSPESSHALHTDSLLTQLDDTVYSRIFTAGVHLSGVTFAAYRLQSTWKDSSTLFQFELSPLPPLNHLKVSTHCITLV